MSNIFKHYFLFIVLLIIFTFLVLAFILYSNSFLPVSNDITVSPLGFVWPTPNYSQITSPFGYRSSPFTGKTSYHSGIDIGAPNGSEVLSCFSGTVTYIGFSGANGYTVRVSNENYVATYSHLSPHFLVYVGQPVLAGQLIATVGPKNVYGVPNNPYKDSNGNPTNGATTRSTFTFFIKKRQCFNRSSYIILIILIISIFLSAQKITVHSKISLFEFTQLNFNTFSNFLLFSASFFPMSIARYELFSTFFFNFSQLLDAFFCSQTLVALCLDKNCRVLSYTGKSEPSQFPPISTNFHKIILINFKKSIDKAKKIVYNLYS